MANFVIIIYSLYHHIAALAEEVKAGIESTGNKATIYQVPETLSDDVLEMLHAPPRPNYPIATVEVLRNADGVIFGTPTRFGSAPAQLKAFIDSTGGEWASGGLYHKPTTVFVSTGTGGGKEVTVVSLLSTFAHHGMIYVPLGYAKAFGELTTLDETHGASPWGSGTIAGPDGSKQPSANELKIAKIQGEEFALAASKLVSVTSKVATKQTEKVVKSSAKTATQPKTETKPVSRASPASEEKSKCCVIV